MFNYQRVNIKALCFLLSLDRHQIFHRSCKTLVIPTGTRSTKLFLISTLILQYSATKSTSKPWSVPNSSSFRGPSSCFSRALRSFERLLERWSRIDATGGWHRWRFETEMARKTTSWKRFKLAYALLDVAECRIQRWIQRRVGKSSGNSWVAMDSAEKGRSLNSRMAPGQRIG